MFDIYIYNAMKKQAITQNELARKVGISSACMSKMRSGKILPSDDTTLKVAALAGIAPEKALIDLNLWRAKDDESRLKVWLNISKMLGCLSTISLIALYNFTYFSNMISTYTVYYVYYTILTIILFQSFRHISEKLIFSKLFVFKTLRRIQKC